ncbi:MAG: peptidylprolyl isomerase [Myxococcales bacterium]
MKVSENTVVSLEYSLHLGDGVIVDRSDDGEPLAYLHGGGQIVPGLEKQLEGMEPGQTKQCMISPAEGYGERDPRKVQEMPRKLFGNHPMKPGDEFVAVDEDQNQIPVRIQAVNGEMITVDFNHPLAGKTLHFNVKVTEVRAATKEELEHGHAHGGDGHEH